MKQTKNQSAKYKHKSLLAISRLRDSATDLPMVFRIGKLLDIIEQSQRDGVSLHQISAALAKTEFPGMNVKCLQNLLYQARRLKKMKSGAIPNACVDLSPPIIVSGDPIASTTNHSIPKKMAQMDSNGRIDPVAILHAANHAVSGQRFSAATRSLLKRETNLIDEGDRK